MRPLWRDLILQVWGGDPLQCPCCKGTMKPVRKVIRREEIEFFLRLHGLWEGIVTLPRPPPPPFDIETMEPIEPPWQAIKEWIQAAEFADGPEDARAEVETERIRCRSDLGMPHARHLTNAFMVAHSSPGMAGRFVYSPTAAGTMNVSA